MSKELDREIELRLERCHEAGECLYATSNRGRKLLEVRRKREDLFSPYPGLYDKRDHWESLTSNERHLCIARALSSLHPGWVFCRETAAVAHGLFSLSPSQGLRPQLCLVEGCHGATRHLADRHYVVPQCPVTVNGVRATSIERTAFDCLRTFEFSHAMVIADAVAKNMGGGPEALAASFSAFKGCHGISKACRRARLADPRCENGGESVLRANAISLGFAVPEMQVTLSSALDLSKEYRLDCLWLREGLTREWVEDRVANGSLRAGDLDGCVAGELDGREKYTNPAMVRGDIVDVLLAERRREAALSLYGLSFVRVSYAEACSLSFLERALLTAGVHRMSLPRSDL